MKIFRVFIIFILTFFIIGNYGIVKAGDGEKKITDIDADKVISSADDFLEAGKSEETPLEEENYKKVSDVVYNILLAVGIIAAVIVGLLIAIKIITGSAGQKAEYKELLIPYITGCVIIFGAFAIWKIAVNLLNETQT
jgi:hypothetical protein